MTQPRGWKEWLASAIAAITILSALIQIIAPDSTLAFIGAAASPEVVYWFRLLSVVTALFGAMLLHSRLSGRDELTVLLWAGLQKVVGALLVAVSVTNGTLAALALSVGVYDFVAGLFLLWYWRSLAAQA